MTTSLSDAGASRARGGWRSGREGGEYDMGGEMVVVVVVEGKVRKIRSGGIYTREADDRRWHRSGLMGNSPALNGAGLLGRTSGLSLKARGGFAVNVYAVSDLYMHALRGSKDASPGELSTDDQHYLYSQELTVRRSTELQILAAN